MTTTTDDGLEWASEVIVGDRAEELNAIAVGTGTGNEGTGATSLANQVHKNDQTDADCTFKDLSATGELEAIITVTGGTEVTAGTTITEIAVFGGFNGGSDTLVVIDEFAGVTVEDGHTEEFTVPVTLQR
jgi:hypothetical protein